jgi:hypothetical protein
LVGSELRQGSSDTPSLEDFVTKERITSKPTTYPKNNSGLVSVLKNLQMTSQIVLSNADSKCFDPFIENWKELNNLWS